MDNGAGFPSAATGACSACSAALTSPFAAPPVTALAPSAARYQRKLTGYSSRSQVFLFVAIICHGVPFVNDFFPAFLLFLPSRGADTRIDGENQFWRRHRTSTYASMPSVLFLAIS